MTPLLDIRGLRTWFPIRRGIFSRTVAHVRAVDGVTLAMPEGVSLGLVGESGCGKSTLARTLMGLERARAGEVFFRGQSIVGLSAARLRPVRRQMQMVFQDPFQSLNPRLTVLEIVTEGLVEHGLIPAAQRRGSARQLLADVGLGPEALHRYPHEFSGGQRQRISIARAISMRPALVVCDEPVSALDVSVRAQVINLLADLRQKYGLCYLFISHDLGVVRQVSDRTAVMYLGKIMEAGPTDEVILRPRHPYTQALIWAIPRIDAARARRVVLQGDVPSPSRPPPGCPFHTRCLHATERCRQVEPPLEPAAAGSDPSHRTACIRQNEIPPFRDA